LEVYFSERNAEYPHYALVRKYFKIEFLIAEHKDGKMDDFEMEILKV
jgi:hypothetical protein